MLPCFHNLLGAFTTSVASVLLIGSAAPAAAEPTSPLVTPRPAPEEVVATLSRKEIWERLIQVARPDVPAPTLADVQHIFGVSAEFARPVDRSSELRRTLKWPRPGAADEMLIMGHGRGLCRWGTQPPEFTTFCVRDIPTVWLRACCIFGEGPEGEDGCPTVASVARQLILWGWTRRPHDIEALTPRLFYEPPMWDIFDRDDGLILLSPGSPTGETNECVMTLEIHRAA